MSEQIQQTVDRLTAFISQTYADADVSPGSVLSELLIKLSAVIQNEQYNFIASLNQSSSIKQALDSTTDTYSPAIDLIASNYNTDRSTGKYATGKLKITVSSRGNYLVSKSVMFIQPALGLRYKVDKTYRVSPTPDLNDGELQLKKSGETYFFILPVQAEKVGSEYQVSSGSIFNLLPPSTIAYFTRAEAYGNFTTGLPIDTDKEVVKKIKKTLGSRRLESPAGIANRLSEIYPTFQTLSVCGANDPELTRAKDNIFGISTFGKADVYVRTSVGPEVKVARLEAVKTAESSWELTLDSDFSGGFYRVISILPASDSVLLSGALNITETVYSYRQFQGARNNEIPKLIDARFSKYQTARIKFNYVEDLEVAEATPVGGRADFEVAVSCQPYITEIQDLLLSDSERFACADYLVRAALPCFISLEIGLVRKRTSDTYESLNLNSLKQDIFNYINTIPFGEDLYASKIVDICHNYDISRVNLPLSIQGNILCNDGTTIAVSGSDLLTIPTNIPKGVSKKTTLYFIDYFRESAGEGGNVVDSIGLKLI
jgi:hypothetical protein